MRLNEMKEGLLLWGLPPRQGIAEIKEQLAAAQGLYILVPEMRPSLFGLEIARRLTKENIRHVYATDNMLGILFSKHKVKEVLFFYKDITKHHYSGICGSLYVCLLAHLHGVSIKPLQGEKMLRPSQAASLRGEYMSSRYNDVLPTGDEAVPEEIVQ